MRKPTKPPPPPPPPPKPDNISPVCSAASLPRQNCCWGGSEYAESVSSVSYSTRSLQPPIRCASPSGYQSCRSESGVHVGSTLGSSSSYRTCCGSIQQSQNCCCHGITCLGSSRGCGLAALVSDRQHAPSPCGTVHSHHSHFSASNNCGHVSYSTHQQFPNNCHDCDSCSNRPSPSTKQFLHHNHHSNNHNHHHSGHHHSVPIPEGVHGARTMNGTAPIPPPHHYVHDNQCIQRVDVVDASANIVETVAKPPVPKERIFRPRMTRSPLPKLKRASHLDRQDVGETYKKCKPSQYKRHMDLHIQTIFRYRSDREKRRVQLEADLRKYDRTDDHLCNNTDSIKDSIDNIKSKIRAHLAARESSYLRSLRSKVSPDDFVEKAKLGKGYMGSVSLVEKRSPTGERPDLFAMKKIKKSQVYQENHMAHVMAERDILAEADNEWIVKLHYSFQDERYLYFILEYLPGGDMIALLSEKGFFSEELARFYIAEISLAVQFVHDIGFIHRDIKPDNILIGSDGHIKLTDFGLCTGFRWEHDSSYYNDNTIGATMNSLELSNQSGKNRSDEHMTITRELIKREIEHSKRPKTLSLVGSPNYIAPEVLRRAHPDNEKLCDWWSVGVILYEMVVGHCPFIDIDNFETNNGPEMIQERIVHWKEFLAFRPLCDNHNRPRQLSDEVINLIKGLLCDQEDRLCQNGIGDIQNHPFFEGLDWADLRNTEAPYKPDLKSEYDTRYFPLDNSLPDQTFNSSRFNGTMVHFTFKNFWSKNF